MAQKAMFDILCWTTMEGLPWWSLWLRLLAPRAGCLGWIPGQSTRSHLLQLTLPYATVKISCDATKTLLEKTLEGPLDCKEIQPVHAKGDQSWIFIGWTRAEAPILWPPDAKSWLTGKEPDAGIDWRWEEKGMTEDEMAGWHHLLNRYEFE